MDLPHHLRRRHLPGGSHSEANTPETAALMAEAETLAVLGGFNSDAEPPEDSA